MVFQLFLQLKIILFLKYIRSPAPAPTSIDNNEEKAPDDKVQGTEN